jgi:hypothetical protein
MAQDQVQSYSLVVLNDSYKNFDDLERVAKPVQSIHTQLEENFGFDSDLIRNSSIQEFLTKLRVYSKQEFNSTDQMMVYVTGYVYHDSIFNMQYLAFPESTPGDVGTMIPLTELLVMVGNIACRHVLLVLDDGPIWGFDKTIEKTAYLNISTLDGYADDDIGNRLIYKTRKYIYLNSDDQREVFHKSIDSFLSSSERQEKVGGIKDFIRHLNQSELGQKVYLGPFLTDEPAGEFLFQYR